MNILILTPYTPYPLNSGGAQGVFNMIDHLRHKHHFTLVISEGGDNRQENKSLLQQLWPEVDIIYYPLLSQMMCLSFLYDKARRLTLKTLVHNSRRLLVERALLPYGEWFSRHHVSFVNNLIVERQIDLVQVEFYECLPWGKYLPGNVKKVFVHHELGFVRKERLLSSISLSAREQELLKASKQKELSDLELYDAVITVTATDKEILEHEGLQTPVYISTLAINTPSFPYKVTPNQLTFVGGYNHLPNREGLNWFTQKVAPLLRDKHLTLNIAGSSWPQSYANYTDIDIHLHGYVEQLHNVALGTIMVVPILSGSGMRMKILEAAAMSLPIVTTKVGVEGLDFKDGESCLVADTPKAFASAICRLNSDSELRRRLGENANKVFSAKYHPSVLAEKRDLIYNKVVPSCVIK